MKRLFFLLTILFAGAFCFPGDSHAKQGPLFNNEKNPFFGDYENQIGLYLSASTGGVRLINLIWPPEWDAEPFGYIMLQYSQPTEVFRLPARRNIQAGYTIGWGSHDGEDWRDYSMPMFGISWDVSFLTWQRFYAGAGLGLSIKWKEDVRQDSRVVFGTKAFLGYRINERFSAELFSIHYSNGNLTQINHSYNFSGVSVLYNF